MKRNTKHDAEWIAYHGYTHYQREQKRKQIRTERIFGLLIVLAMFGCWLLASMLEIRY